MKVASLATTAGLISFTFLLSAHATLAAGAAACEPVPRTYSQAEFSVDVTEYAPTQVSEKSILIMPPTGGTTTIDRRYAHHLCLAGFNIHILNKWTEEPISAIDFALHQRFYGRGNKAVGLVLDKVRNGFVGILGTSVGALHASVAASSFPRINAVFLIVGGAPIAQVIVTSDQKAMIDLRQARRRNFKLNTDEEQIDAIGKAFSLEPLADRADLYKHQHVGMVVALEDTTVATATQLQLEKAWKPETIIHLNNGHFWAIVKTWLFHTDDVVDFFKRSANPT